MVSLMQRRREMMQALGKSAIPVYQMAQLDASGWTVKRCSISFDGLKTVATVISSSTTALKQAYFLCDPTHKYALTGIYKKESTTSGIFFGMYEPGSNGRTSRVYYEHDPDADVQISSLMIPNSSYYAFTINHGTPIVAPAETIIDKLQLYDMTLMFGAGNEPTTFAGFETACASAGIDLTEYHPYIAYEAKNLVFNGTSDYVDTGLCLFSSENINRDFKMTALVNCPTIPTTGEASKATIICAKYDSSDPPGFLIRSVNSNSTTYKGTLQFAGENTDKTLIVKRLNGVISTEGPFANNPQFINGVHNQPLMLGCALTTNGERYRYAAGTIKHIKIEWL